MDRVSRLTAVRTALGWTMVPNSELALVTDGCAQFSSHASGDVAFGPDGMLYASAGDGASFRGPGLRPGQQPVPATPSTRAARCAPRTSARRRCLRPARHRRHDLPAPPGHPAHPDPGDRRPVAGGDGPAQPVAAHLPAGQGAAVERRRRLQQLGGDQLPPRRPDAPAWSTAAGPATRAPPGSRCATPPGTPSTSRSARSCTPRGPARSRRRSSATGPAPARPRSRRARTARSSPPRCPASPSASSGPSGRRPTRTRCSSPTSCAGASGGSRRAPNGQPDPGSVRGLRAGRRSTRRPDHRSGRRPLLRRLRDRERRASSRARGGVHRIKYIGADVASPLKSSPKKVKIKVNGEKRAGAVPHRARQGHQA